MYKLTYPVLCFWKNFLRIEQDESSLTTTTKAGLKNGMFRNMLIVDSEGNGYLVTNANKICGIGFLCGYNIFLNQKIKVELVFDKELHRVPLEEVKANVNNSFRNWRGWQSGDNLDEFKDKINNAASIQEIINVLTEKKTTSRQTKGS